MITIGWREHVSFPSLNVEKVQAKIDTGSLYSVLDVGRFHIDNDKVTFSFRLDSGELKNCHAKLLRMYQIANTSGEQEYRPMIEIPMVLADGVYTIKASLSNREKMNYRVLLGRDLLASQFIVDVSQEFIGAPSVWD